MPASGSMYNSPGSLYNSSGSVQFLRQRVQVNDHQSPQVNDHHQDFTTAEIIFPTQSPPCQLRKLGFTSKRSQYIKIDQNIQAAALFNAELQRNRYIYQSSDDHTLTAPRRSYLQRLDIYQSSGFHFMRLQSSRLMVGRSTPCY